MGKHQDLPYDPYWNFKTALSHLLRALDNSYRYEIDVKQNEPHLRYNYVYGHSRSEFMKLRDRQRQWMRHKDLHPVVHKLATDHRPDNWHLLLLEWPHVSEADPSKLAFTRSEADWMVGDFVQEHRRTRTSIGKYVKRHWSRLPDHVIRDYVATYTMDEMRIDRTTPGIIMGIELGARSCMQSSYGNIPFSTHDNEIMRRWMVDKSQPEPDWHKHPYVVYDPQYGWGMATRTKDGEVLGRALVNYEEMVFVRSYVRRSNEQSSSGSDHILEEWLRAQGFSHRGAWPEGLKLSRVEHPYNRDYDFMVPYLDGAHHNLRDEGDYLVVDEEGPICADYTDGGYSSEDDRDTVGYCENCDETIYEDDDHFYAGRYEDRLICSGCRADHYTRANTEVGGVDRVRLIHEDDVSHCVMTSRAFDHDNPPSWVRQLHNGDWAHEDYCVYVESVGDYYLTDDEDIALDSDTGEYMLKEDMWQDSDTDEWHSDHDSYVDYEGRAYHADNCWVCAADDVMYPHSVVRPVEVEGATVHPNNLAAYLAMSRVNADAEPCAEPA